MCVNRNSIQWMCTFCVFRSNQGCYYQDELKRDAAMSAQISQHMLVSALSDPPSSALRILMPVTLTLVFLTPTGMPVSPPAPVQCR